MSRTKENDGGWKKFVWNSEKKEFLGRTGSSWLKITTFYIIFYGCLAGIFIGTIQAMLLTLSNYKPTHQDRVAPPGLSHTPRSLKSEISFNVNDEKSYKDYISSIEELLEPYNEDLQTDGQNYEDCGADPQKYRERGELENGQGKRKACRFSRKWLNACSGVGDNTYGFAKGKPCLIVKLNRIINFRPRVPTNNETIPEPITSKVKPYLIPIYCKHKRDEDEGKIGEIKYYGFDGEPAPQYLQPLVAVHFTNLTQGEALRIECKVFGDNIDYSEKDRYQGRFDVKFTISKS
uniref:Sodium/potassium-transporting ATPase subunit beta n=1 Tax=Neogobius melanostomus TaxID=47308 RepID=A0A8C6TV49_9GOBI